MSVQKRENSMQRRHFIAGAIGLAASAAVGLPALAAGTGWRMPDEGDRHAATWMAFGANDAVWGKRLKTGAQADLARIAQAIASVEPVHMLVNEEDYDVAARLCGNKVKLLVQPIDDLWIRDTGPVFVKKAGGALAGVNFNFNGWGEKQDHDDDALVAPFVAGRAGVAVLASSLVLEGGGIEVDGQGTAIITESCVLNANRNPGVGKAQCERELRRLLGIEKVIWLPGIAGKDITDGHTDFYARFCAPGAPSPSATSTSCARPRMHAAVRCKWWSCLARGTCARAMKTKTLPPATSIFMCATAPCCARNLAMRQPTATRKPCCANTSPGATSCS
jgi:agmatine deiminase